MAGRIQKAKLYLGSRQVVGLTDKSMEMASNASTVATQTGPVIIDGMPTGSQTFNHKVVKGSTVANEMIEAMREKKILTSTWGPVGGKALSSQVLVTGLTLASNEQDGDNSGSVTLLPIEGLPDQT